MILDVAQSMALLILSLVASLVLLGILGIVHQQTAKMKDLELRMKAMENIEVTDEQMEGDKA